MITDIPLRVMGLERGGATEITGTIFGLEGWVTLKPWRRTIGFWHFDGPSIQARNQDAYTTRERATGARIFFPNWEQIGTLTFTSGDTATISQGPPQTLDTRIDHRGVVRGTGGIQAQVACNLGERWNNQAGSRLIQCMVATAILCAPNTRLTSKGARRLNVFDERYRAVPSHCGPPPHTWKPGFGVTDHFLNQATDTIARWKQRA